MGPTSPGNGVRLAVQSGMSSTRGAAAHEPLAAAGTLTWRGRGSRPEFATSWQQARAVSRPTRSLLKDALVAHMHAISVMRKRMHNDAGFHWNVRMSAQSARLTRPYKACYFLHSHLANIAAPSLAGLTHLTAVAESGRERSYLQAA